MIARVDYPDSPLHGSYIRVLDTEVGLKGSRYYVQLLVGRGVYHPGDTLYLSGRYLVMQEGDRA